MARSTVSPTVEVASPEDFADLAVAQTSRAEQQALTLGVGEQAHRIMQPPKPFFFEHGPLRRRFIDRGRFDFGIQLHAEAPTIGLLAVARGIVGDTKQPTPNILLQIPQRPSSDAS